MLNFDLFLTAPNQDAADAAALLQAFRALPHRKPVPGDPARFWYHNPNTAVHFNLVLGHAVLEQADGAASARHDALDPLDLNAPPGRNTSHSHPDDEPDAPDPSEFEDEDDEEPEVDEAAVTVHLPLFRPTFFLQEALAVLAALRHDTGHVLLLESKVESAGKPSVSEEEVVERWRDTHRAVYPELEDRERVQVWSETRCHDFYAYGTALSTLGERYSAEGLAVLPMQPALHGGTLKTLCVWRCDQPAVIPRTDLVLLERPSGRRGLLRRRKVDELLVPWDVLERVLQPHTESQGDPALALILRAPDGIPERLQRELAELQGEPPENARRTEFAGVVDFDPS